MSAEPTQAVVRLRWMRGVFTSKLMPLAEASQLAEDLRKEVVACGDGCRFVQLVGYDGREVHVRGREVVAVEYVPDLPDRIRPPATGGHVQQAPLSLDSGQESDGTAFLRSLAGVPSRGQR